MRLGLHSQRLGPESQPLEVAPLQHGLQPLRLGLHSQRLTPESQRLEVVSLPIGVELLPIGCECGNPEVRLLRLGPELQRLDPESQRLEVERRRLDPASLLPGPDNLPAMHPPRLSGVVVHWRDEEHLAELTAAWPRDPRFELIVVDNGSSKPLELGPARLVRPKENLGFAGGANAGVAEARGEILLILNPDVAPQEGALDRLLEGFEALDAAGLAPKLVGPAGESQAGWQLRLLPSPWQLLFQAFPLAGTTAERIEPSSGAPVEQPAAAALALRREAFERIGGFDPAFHPAWFEDVDLARRMKDAGLVLRYWPAAVFRHQLGSTVLGLGYGRFLWIYYRNLTRYLAKHHGRLWALAVRIALIPGMAMRLVLLPLYRPRRAASRVEALRGLLAVLAGTLSGWRRPLWNP